VAGLVADDAHAWRVERTRPRTDVRWGQGALGPQRLRLAATQVTSAGPSTK
jgi:hypothetical protein